jgi:WD40 repeat protein
MKKFPLILFMLSTLFIYAEDKIIYKKSIHLYSRSRAYSVAFLPDGNTLLVGSGDLENFNFGNKIVTSTDFTGNDKTIKLWDLTNYKEVTALQGHTDRVKSVAFSTDGAYIVSAGFDKTARVWNVASGKETAAFTGHSGPVFSALFIDGNTHVVSGGESIYLWDASTGKQIKKLGGNDEQITSLVVTPDGKSLISASYNGGIKIWNLGSGSVTKNLLGHKRGAFTLALSSNGKYLISGDVEGTMKLWELPAGKELQSIQVKGCEGIYSIAISPDDKYAASVGESANAFLWDLKL